MTINHRINFIHTQKDNNKEEFTSIHSEFIFKKYN